MKNMKNIRRKELLKKTKIYSSDTTHGEFAFVLFENEETERGWQEDCCESVTGPSTFQFDATVGGVEDFEQFDGQLEGKSYEKEAA